MKPKKYYDRLKLAVLFLVLSFSVIACKNDDPDPIAIKNEQTVFMYMPWASNLLSAFRRNIDDMEKAILERGLRNEKVLVFLAETPTQASLFEFVYNKSPFYPAEKKKVTRKVLKEYRFSSTPEYTTTAGISSILKDVRSYAEARRYGMVIGCHGMGWLPVVPTKKKTLRSSRQTDKEMPEVYKKHWEYTDRPMTRYFGGFDSQYQTEIKTLADAIADAGMKMEYILFDDCYMATVEVAYELRKATDYLIGSTCEIMEYGMPYDIIGKHLLGNVNYKAITEGFYSFYSNYVLPHGTISVTKCSEMDELVAIMRDINQRFTFDEALLGTLQKLDGYNPVKFFDCGDYAAKLCQDPVLLDQFNKQLERAVPYKQYTEYYYSMGLPSPGTAKIHTFSGITISDPSIHPATITAKTETSWYKATH